VCDRNRWADRAVCAHTLLDLRHAYACFSPTIWAGGIVHRCNGVLSALKAQACHSLGLSRSHMVVVLTPVQQAVRSCWLHRVEA
jgi:hypothetical protein